MFVEGGVAVIGELTVSFSPAPSGHGPPDVLMLVVVEVAGAEEPGPGTEVECCGSGNRFCCCSNGTRVVNTFTDTTCD